MKKTFYFLLLIVFLIGCTTQTLYGPFPNLTRHFVVGDHGEDKAKVFFARRSIFFGDGALCQIYWNEKHIANLEIEQWFTFYAPPGKHIIGLLSVTPSTTAMVAEKELILDAGKEYYFTCGIGIAQFTLKEISKEKYLEWLESPSMKELKK